MQILQFSTRSAPNGADGSRSSVADSTCSKASINFEDLKANNTGVSKFVYEVSSSQPNSLNQSQLFFPEAIYPPEFYLAFSRVVLSAIWSGICFELLAGATERV